jgi:guanylate kinase
MGRLVILSGPSCIGKGPLHAALKRLYPDVAEQFQKIVLHNSRPPRPGEQDGVDYHFRTRGQIEALRDEDNYVVMEVRGDLQALNLAELAERLDHGDAFFEGNPFVGGELLTCPLPEGAERLSIFLSPLSRAEIAELKAPERHLDLPSFVADIMRRKLLRRTQRQKAILSLKDLEDIERRCTSAYREMTMAHQFQHVLPNHDGEDSENWDAFYYPVADARRTLRAVVDLLEGRVPAVAETWPQDLLP